VSDLDYEDTDTRDEVEARVDAGDGLDPNDVCSFRTHNIESPPCPHHPVGKRVLGGVDLDACEYHYAQGGYLTDDAMRYYGRQAIARMNRDAAESARRLGIEPEDRTAWPTRCERCGVPIFTGNSTGKCAECNMAEDAPTFPWNLDRHSYAPTVCGECGAECLSNWCSRCGRTIIGGQADGLDGTGT
jgi:hypothetical protein